MSLHDGNVHTAYTVHAIDLPLNLGKRLEALGMTEGTRVVLLGKKKSGAVIVKVRGTRFAMGKTIAQSIFVGV